MLKGKIAQAIASPVQKPLLHVLAISTANIDRSPIPPFSILYIFYTVPPPTLPSTILHLYTANYRAGGRGLPPLP